uniref:Uncharacterized protein n=1 Tax=Solanum tuberosum TaxID=4113 RepID=M1DBC2_SOLTU
MDRLPRSGISNWDRFPCSGIHMGSVVTFRHKHWIGYHVPRFSVDVNHDGLGRDNSGTSYSAKLRTHSTTINHTKKIKMQEEE